LGGGEMQCEVCVYTGEALARYGFPGGHPFGVDRHGAFVAHLAERGLAGNVCHREPVMAARAVIERFHTAAYVDFVMQRAARGGYFDHGDTPAFPGAYEAAACVVGTGVDAATAIMAGACRRAFVPIAGLHHARRDAAAGFCVFNDCGVVIETLRAEYGLARIAYVDIDAHHGDGVFYAFEDDPGIFIADIHVDGRGGGLAARGVVGLLFASESSDASSLPPRAIPTTSVLFVHQRRERICLRLFASHKDRLHAAQTYFAARRPQQKTGSRGWHAHPATVGAPRGPALRYRPYARHTAGGGRSRFSLCRRGRPCGAGCRYARAHQVTRHSAGVARGVDLSI